MLRFFPTVWRVKFFFVAAILTVGCARTPIPDDVAVVLIESRALHLDPLQATDAMSQKIGHLIHASLVRLSARMELEGELAQSWSQVRYTRFRFKLRPGLRFQDGSPLSPADVIESIHRFQGESPNAVAFKHIRRVWSDGPLDIQFETDSPQPFLLNDLPSIKVLKAGPKGWIGAGRYQVVSQSDDEIILKIAETYFEPVPAEALRELRFEVVGDDTTRHQMLVRGDANVAINALGLSKTTYLRNHLPSALQMVDQNGINYSYLCFNFREPHLAKLKVRQAIARAVNVADILKYRVGGFGAPATGILSPVLREYYQGDVARYDYDPAAAERLLDEAGYPRQTPNGWRFSLRFKTTNDKFGNEITRIMVGDLRKIGIDARLDVVEQAMFFSQIKAGDFHLFHSRWIGVSSPSIYFRAFHSSQIGNLNRGAYSNPRMDQLIDQGMREIDDAKRKRVFSEAQKLAASDLPYVNLWYWNNTFIGAKDMANIVMYPNGDFRTLAEIRIKK